MHIVAVGAKDNNRMPEEIMAPAGLKCYDAFASHLAHYLCCDIFPPSLTIPLCLHRQVNITCKVQGALETQNTLQRRKLVERSGD